MWPRIISIFILVAFFQEVAPAQDAPKIKRADFQSIYNYVALKGPLDGYTLQAIVDTITGNSETEEDMAAAIYYWIGKNIPFDIQGYHQAGHNDNTWVTLQNRRATPVAYALLFEAMCKLAHIQCITIYGNAKRFPEQIGEQDKSQRHAWNRIEIRGFKYFVDVCWGAGHTDHRLKEFTYGDFTDGWLMTDRFQFAFCHLPDDPEMLPQDVKFSKLQFKNAPVIDVGAIGARAWPLSLKGTIKTRTGTCLRLIFHIEFPQWLRNVCIQWDDEEPIPAEYYFENELLHVDIPVTRSGKRNLWINWASIRAFGYRVEAHGG